MTDENLPNKNEMEDELPDPDTDTGDEGQDDFVPQAIPVAEPTVSDSEPDPEPAPAAAAPVRVYPQQYTLLFASVLMLAGSLTVWERGHVTGDPDRYGFQMIGGGLVFALALYCVVTGMVSLLRGGVRFGAPLLTGFFAVYFVIRSMLRLSRLDTFRYFGDLKDQLGLQGGIDTFFGQFGPGIWLNLFGGLVIFWLFFKAMFGGKKKDEAAPAPRRRGRR